jgi:TetR/AcrR family transcriptional regulator
MKTSETEQHIKDTAKRMFFGEGRFNARLHEIAAEAGVNKALLHYYFRNRDRLFETVSEEAIDESFLAMFRILGGPGDFETRIASAVREIITSLARYPYIESFIVAEINRNPAGAPGQIAVKGGRAFTQRFLGEVKTYLRKKKAKDLTPQDFLVNMMALCAYAASTKPVICSILNLSEKQFRAFCLGRVPMVTRMVLLK